MCSSTANRLLGGLLRAGAAPGGALAAPAAVLTVAGDVESLQPVRHLASRPGGSVRTPVDRTWV